MDVTHETQRSITQWGRQTFGSDKSALEIAARMQLEMVELLQRLAEDQDDLPLALVLSQLREVAQRVNSRVNQLVDTGAELACLDAPSALEECADIDIMLLQVVSCLGGNALDERTKKMKVNRGRTWSRGRDGVVQHVEAGA